jgi:hypothetical protein
MDFTETKAGQSKEMPSKIVLYGVPKIGKTRFAAQADDVFFIDIEGGLDYLDKSVRATPKLKTYDEVIAWLKHIYEDEKFTCGTIAIDSLDWLETLAQERLIKANNAKSITDSVVKEFAYFKGVMNAADDVIKVFKWLDAIHTKKGIKSILIAHSQIKNVDLPTQDPYSRHEMKLSKYLAAKANEWGDLVLFADYTFHVTKDKKTSEPKPVLCAGGSASFIGGGRMLLAKELPLDYKQLEKHIKGDK